MPRSLLVIHTRWRPLSWSGMVWYGMVWCGMVWYGVVWCGTILATPFMGWYGMVWWYHTHWRPLLLQEPTWREDIHGGFDVTR